MEIVDKIKEFSNRNYFSLSQCIEHGITRYEISQLQDKGLITKVKYGLYAFSDILEDEESNNSDICSLLEDELFIPQVFSNKIVYSNETALYFEGYSDQVPFTYTVTVPKGYHSKILWNDFIVRQTPIELFDKGIKEISSPYGNPIKIYCIERTLCDLLRSRKDFNKERYIPAVQKYMRSKQKDLYKIMEYAKLLNVENKIRPYLEVLL